MPKIKNWCQNGVKSRKSDDYKEEKVLQTPSNQGLQKKSQNISTQLLTVLIMSVILRIEQKINGYLNIDKYPLVKEERV